MGAGRLLGDIQGMLGGHWEMLKDGGRCWDDSGLMLGGYWENIRSVQGRFWEDAVRMPGC